LLESFVFFPLVLQPPIAHPLLSKYDPIIRYGDIKRRVRLNLHNCVPRHGYLSENIRFKIDARFIHAHDSPREPIAVLEHHLSCPSWSCQPKINDPECRSHIASLSVLVLEVVRLTEPVHVSSNGRRLVWENSRRGSQRSRRRGDWR